MNDNSAIHIQNLGKKYKRYSNRWSRLAEWVSRGHLGRHKGHWALRGITLDVQGGDSIGIIGQNGAGKSTLLKILTGTTQPTEGSMMVEGRISAILELGMGFHPDFTGRQNAVLSCRMAGLPAEEVQACLPEIRIFSELGDYFDQPLRVYSTGMQMRLAFSCATIVRPDILIVDEALAVGDVYFQHKCTERIRTITEGGATLLIVSHDPSAIKSLCRRALLLDEGQMLHDGNPETVLDYYNGMIARKTKDQEIRQIEDGLGGSTTRSGSGRAKIKSVEMTDAAGNKARAFCVGDIAKLIIRIGFEAAVENPTIGFDIRDRLGNDIFGTNTFHLDAPMQSYRTGDSLGVEFSITLNLGCGNYSISVSIHSHDTHLAGNYDWWDRCLVFQVVPGNTFRFIGAACLPVEMKLTRGATTD